MLVTIAICTRNRPMLLRRALQAVEELSVPKGVDTEVLICDNGDTLDTTREIVAQLRGPDIVRILIEPRIGKSNGLLRLIGEARGEWILFLDDDVRPARDWLTGYVDAMDRYPAAAFFGGQILPDAATPLSGLPRYVFRVQPGVCGVITAQEDSPLAPLMNMNVGGGNMACRRETLLRPSIRRSLQLLAERSASAFEDTVMMLDLLSGGEEGWLLATPKVFHYLPRERSGLRWFWRWWYIRGQACRKFGNDVPAGADLRRFILRRRGMRLRQYAVSLRFGAVSLTLLSLVALGAGYLSAGRQRRPVSGDHGTDYATDGIRKEPPLPGGKRP